MSGDTPSIFDHLDDEPEAADLSNCDPEEAGDHLFLDGLLQRLHHADEERREARIKSALARIEKPPLRLLRSHRIASLAAAILLTTGVLWLLLDASAPTARAAVEKALKAAQVAADRLYDVVIERSLPGPPQLEASLFVHGGEKFVIELPGMTGGTIWAGCDGRVTWLIPAWPPLPVLVSEDSRLLDEWMRGQEVQLPFLQITSVLERMQAHYDLEFSDGEKDLDDRISILGKRREDDPLLPLEIRFQAERESGTVQELLLRFDGTGPLPTPRSMRFVLVDELPRPPGWYEHAAHHDQGRRVRHF
ncbi:MAG: hypothetical protein V2A76_01165 [Planctomycetota bacterium]